MWLTNCLGAEQQRELYVSLTRYSDNRTISPGSRRA